MSDRLFTLIGAGLALILAATLLIGPPRQSPEAESRPTSQDRGTSGMLGLHRWLEGAGIPVQRLHQRYTALDEVAPGTGNLLVAAEPMVWAVRPSEAGAVRDWVERGNHVLLLGRTQTFFFRSQGRLADALGLERAVVGLSEENNDPKLKRRREDCAGEAMTRGTIAGPQRRLRPATNAGHPVLRGVREVLVKRPSPQRNGYYFALEYAEQPRHWLGLLCDPQMRIPVFGVFRIGEGRVWALDYGEAFANDNLARGDNARLLANLAAFALRPGARVVFDDMHQGDSELYDPEAFYSDPRLHGTIAFLFGMWLLWLLGYSSRFAPPVAGAARLTSRAFVLATARFQARYLRRPEAARGLLRNFFNDVRRRYRLPTTGEPAWEALQRAAGRADADLRLLREWHERVEQGRPVDLPALRNLILKVQESLT